MGGKDSYQLGPEKEYLLEELLMEFRRAIQGNHIEESWYASFIPKLEIDIELGIAFVNALSKFIDIKTAVFLKGLLSRSKNKRLQKAAKRILFILKQKGVEIKENEKREWRLEIAGRKSPDSYMGEFGDENSFWAVVSLKGAYNSHILATFSFNFREGLTNFVAGSMSKNEARNMLNGLRESSPLYSVPPSHIKQIWDELATLPGSIDAEARENFIQVRKYFTVLVKENEDVHPMEKIFSEKQRLSYISKETAEELFTTTFLLNYFLPSSMVNPYIKEYLQLYETPLLPDKQGKEFEINQFIDKSVVAIFDRDDHRRLISRELKELAYLFYLKGMEKEAAQLMGVVLELKEPLSFLSVNIDPFLKVLFHRSIDLYLKSDEESPKESSLIITP